MRAPTKQWNQSKLKPHLLECRVERLHSKRKGSVQGMGMGECSTAPPQGLLGRGPRTDRAMSAGLGRTHYSPREYETHEQSNPMKPLSNAEEADLDTLLERGGPLPEHWRRRLFPDDRGVSPVGRECQHRLLRRR